MSGWTRRSVLRLGVATGIGATAAKIPSAFGAAAAPAAEPDALILHAIPQRPQWPAPSIITRAQWGCNEALRKPGVVYDSVVEKIVVHHTATATNPPDPAADIRSMYQVMVAGVYFDMEYHFLIDQHGHVYEGRWARDYPSGVPHTGENALHQNVQGAATLDHNPRTIAVAMIGNFTFELPTPAALSSLVTVLTWKCARWGIDPQGATVYRNVLGDEVFPDILPHRAVVPTICPGDPITARLPLIRSQVAQRLRDGMFGYWIAGADGTTRAFGDLPDVGDPHRLAIPGAIQAIAGHPSSLGYWALGTDGGVFTFGTAAFFGSMGGTRLNQPVIGITSTRTGNGYWLLARDGGIFSFGDARFFGSTGNIHLNQPVVAMCATPSGNGYWLLARDGGVFCFGDARFFGSTGSIRLNQPIVAMCASPTNNGYWLLARDGGMFCFGDAHFFGSGPQRGLRVPAVAIAATTTGQGYAILAADGSVLPFGDARSYGNSTGTAVGFAGRLTGAG